MKHALPLLLVLALVLPAGARAGEETPTLEEAVAHFLDAPDTATAEEWIADLLLQDPQVAEVERLLAKGRDYPADVATGWLQRGTFCTDGVRRNVLLYVPEDYDATKRYRLVVDLHGGVSRPEMLSFEELEQMKFFWGAHAKEHGYLLAIPTGQVGAEWWTPVGARNVLDTIQRIRHEYNVDENLVVAVGFSDGASGSFYLALTHPTPFAAFVPLNGHLAVTQAGGLQTHLLNLRNKPLYVVNTENDSLYPSASVKPIIEALEPLGVDLVWRDIPEYTHNPMYVPSERPAIWSWLLEHPRNPHPKAVTWQGAAGMTARVHWLEVEDARDVSNDVDFPDPNPAVSRGRVLLGVTVDQTFPGPGVRITSVSDGSPAAAVGLEEGDVLLGLDDTDLEGLQELRRALGGKDFGDAFTLRYRRGDETRTAEGRFPEDRPEPVFRRTMPWGAVEATYADNAFDVRVESVAAFDLLLSAAMVDFERPVKVTVNGKVVYDARVEPDLAFLLGQAARDRDRTTLYRARLPISVPHGTGSE